MFYERRSAAVAQMAELRKVPDVIGFKCRHYETTMREGSEKQGRDRIPPRYSSDRGSSRRP